MPPVSHQIRRAQKGDGAAAVAALADAFHDDPVMTWLLGTRVRREPKLRMMFGGAIGAELAKPDHLVDVGGDGMGVALWHEVDDWKSPDRPLRQVLPAAFRIFGWRLPMAMRVRPAMESVHPEAPHRYLAFIGVHRSKQGTGLGGALLRSMLDECDESGIPAYLESSNPANEALYHRFGFENTGKVPLPRGAPPMTAMWRDPR